MSFFNILYEQVSYFIENNIALIIFILFAIFIFLYLIRKAIKIAIFGIIFGIIIFSMFNFTAMKPIWYDFFPNWNDYNIIFKGAIISTIGILFTFTTFIIITFKKLKTKRNKKSFFRKKYKCEHDEGGKWNSWTKTCNLSNNFT